MASKTERLLEVTRRFLEVNPDAEVVIMLANPEAAWDDYRHRFGPPLAHAGVRFWVANNGIRLTAAPGDSA